MNSGNDSQRERGLKEWDALMVRALKQPPGDSLPEDFAATTAARIELLDSASDDRFERWLQIALFVMLLVAGTAAAAMVDGRWGIELLASSFATAQAAAGGYPQWICAAGICLALSLALERVWRRRRDE